MSIAATISANGGDAGRNRTRDIETCLDLCATDHEFSRRFRIEHVLGVGAQGIVVSAHHLGLDTRVALKMMRPWQGSPRSADRFLFEARMAARLRSPNLVDVHDVGALANGGLFLVMEYLEGCDLAAFLRQRIRLTLTEAAEIVLQAARGIGVAHAHGVIHRDLKPANLFVSSHTAGVRIKVLDLGVCARANPIGDYSEFAGTPGYMAPEQMASPPRFDERSDIWSLGVILYELVVGARPFQGCSISQVRKQVRDAYPTKNCDAVPRPLRRIVERCLSQDPARRYQSICELVSDLSPYARGKVVPSEAQLTSTGVALGIALTVPIVAALGSSAPLTTSVVLPDIEEHRVVLEVVLDEPPPAPEPSRAKSREARPARVSDPLATPD